MAEVVAEKAASTVEMRETLSFLPPRAWPCASLSQEKHNLEGGKAEGGEELLMSLGNIPTAAAASGQNCLLQG